MPWEERAHGEAEGPCPPVEEVVFWLKMQLGGRMGHVFLPSEVVGTGSCSKASVCSEKMKRNCSDGESVIQIMVSVRAVV